MHLSDPSSHPLEFISKAHKTMKRPTDLCAHGGPHLSGRGDGLEKYSASTMSGKLIEVLKGYPPPPALPTAYEDTSGHCLSKRRQGAQRLSFGGRKASEKRGPDSGRP